MASRSQEIDIDINDMSIQQKLEPGKVLIIVLDGNQGKAKMCEAVEHGLTIIETAKGKTARIRFEDCELF
ncbi:MAG: XtrA/YqaO family protein [Bacillus sp. (in: Bacteria)]|nr:XtrA/YqaO family protein [Bacillus sp. (in: firmicutes)]